MPQTNIDSAVVGDVGTQFIGQSNLAVVDTFQVMSETTEAPQGDKEFRWQMQDWPENLGYYKIIPELQTAIDAKTKWTMGAGFEADEGTTLILMGIKGQGNDSFNGVLANQDKVKTIGGDSFAEIIRDDDAVLANLKPIDPSSMVVVFNKQGIILRYEQVDKKNKLIQNFEPEEIFHLSRCRIADEVHGISVIPAVKWIINARNEAMTDWKRVLHRNIDPLWVYHLDTDDVDEIAKFKATQDKARATGESMYVPKGVVVPEQVATAQNATLNPLNWINQLNDYFFQVVNVPQIMVGNAKEFTDASGKIVYLAFEQSVKADQLYLEEQVLAQLNLEIELTFPASLQNDTISDDSEMELEEEPIEEAAQPNDLTEEVEGKT